MIKEALQYIVGLKAPVVEEVKGISYSDKGLIPILPYYQEEIKASSLTSVVEYIKNDVDKSNMALGRTIINIHDYKNVSVMSETDEMTAKRNFYLKAEAQTPQFNFGHFYDAESFNILLQSTFVFNDDTEVLLKVVGNLKEEAVKNIGDDGVSQAVTIKTGIATVSDVRVPNPVSLRPYRTFLEIEQPESSFVFRMRDGGKCALFEADGGAWKSNAVKYVKKYLEYELSEFIEKGIVIILG